MTYWVEVSSTAKAEADAAFLNFSNTLFLNGRMSGISS